MNTDNPTTENSVLYKALMSLYIRDAASKGAAALMLDWTEPELRAELHQRGLGNQVAQLDASLGE